MLKKKRIIAIVTILFSLPIGYLIMDSILFDGIRPKKVNENGIQANFFVHDTSTHQTTVVLVGGGHWGDYWGQAFAQKGYAGLSLPYNNREGLPKLMEEIPLEYFEKAVNWLVEQPEVNSNKIVLMGASRNAELALLIATTFPDIVHGVIAYAPGAVSWSNTVMPFNSDALKPSWTYQDKAVPFIAMEKIKGNNADTIHTLEYWKQGLSDSIQTHASSIKVEHINGPVLLLSGKDDLVWPSVLMSNMIEKRLKENDFKFDVQNLQYENAGHLISGNPNTTSTERTGQLYIDGKGYKFEFGGSMEGDQKAQQDAQKKVFEFISTI